MKPTLIELSEDAFDAIFPLIQNHLYSDATWCFDESGGCLFEPYGTQLEFVQRQHPRAVWTLVDGDDGNQHLLSGAHLVNRVGYLVSTVLLREGVEAEVCIYCHDQIGHGDEENRD